MPPSRTLIALVLTAFTIAGCTHSPKATLAWRWSFQAVRMPNVAGFLDSIKNDYANGPAEEMENYFLDYKLILRSDNTCDLVLFRNYLHGTWAYYDESRELIIKDDADSANPLRMEVDSVNAHLLVLKIPAPVVKRLMPSFEYGRAGASYFMQDVPFIFFLTADKDRYNHEASDVYSKQNNYWRIKPTSRETAQQLRQRVENHLQFCKLIMQDALDREKSYISFNSVRTPLILATGGVGLKSYETVRDAWDESFYDTLQAQAGYVLLERSITKGVLPGASSNRFQNNATMLGEVIDNLKSLSVK